MKRVNNTSKSLSNAPTIGNPSVPSMGGDRAKVHFKPVHPLNIFLKSHAISELDSRKAGIYKLERFSQGGKGSSEINLILSYRIKKTTYRILSYTKIKVGQQTTGKEGHVKISKRFFQTKTFKLIDLPKNVQDSINKNIVEFNTLYGEKLSITNDKKIKKEQKKKQGFFNGLDT